MIIFVDILITDSVRHAGEVLKTLPFFPAATLVVYHILIKIREKISVLTQHSVNEHKKPVVRRNVCLSHTGGLMR